METVPTTKEELINQHVANKDLVALEAMQREGDFGGQIERKLEAAIEQLQEQANELSKPVETSNHQQEVIIKNGGNIEEVNKITSNIDTELKDIEIEAGKVTEDLNKNIETIKKIEAHELEAEKLKRLALNWENDLNVSLKNLEETGYEKSVKERTPRTDMDLEKFSSEDIRAIMAITYVENIGTSLKQFDPNIDRQAKDFAASYEAMRKIKGTDDPTTKEEKLKKFSDASYSFIKTLADPKFSAVELFKMPDDILDLPLGNDIKDLGKYLKNFEEEVITKFPGLSSVINNKVHTAGHLLLKKSEVVFNTVFHKYQLEQAEELMK
jgi:hypothetical protein